MKVIWERVTFLEFIWGINLRTSKLDYKMQSIIEDRKTILDGENFD